MRDRYLSTKTLLVPVLPVFLVLCGLLILEPDFGSVVTLFLVLVGLLWAGGAPWKVWAYLVGAAVTAAAFAVYSVGTFQLPIVDVLYTPISELLQIGLAESDGAGRPPRAGLALFHEAVLQLSFAFLPTIGLLFVTAPVLIEFLFSARYLEAVPIFRVTALSVVLAVLPLDGVMRARAQNRFMLVLSAGKLAATVSTPGEAGVDGDDIRAD